MRAALGLLTLLFCISTNVSAGEILHTQFFNSDLSYGTGSPYHLGLDGWAIVLDGLLGVPNTSALDFEATGGAFVHQTLFADATGNVVASHYLYQGGTFRMDILVGSVGGTFVAQIIEMQVSTREPEGNLYASYLLGPGAFDGPIARAFGIGTNTLGGLVYSDMIVPFRANNFGLLPGDYTSPVRGAWDGYTLVDIELPEPSLAILSLVAVSAFWLRPRERHGH